MKHFSSIDSAFTHLCVCKRPYIENKQWQEDYGFDVQVDNQCLRERIAYQPFAKQIPLVVNNNQVLVSTFCCSIINCSFSKSASVAKYHLQNALGMLPPLHQSLKGPGWRGGVLCTLFGLYWTGACLWIGFTGSRCVALWSMTNFKALGHQAVGQFLAKPNPQQSMDFDQGTTFFESILKRV